MLCNKCGSEIPDTSKFCPNCGESVRQQKKESKHIISWILSVITLLSAYGMASIAVKTAVFLAVAGIVVNPVVRNSLHLPKKIAVAGFIILWCVASVIYRNERPPELVKPDVQAESSAESSAVEVGDISVEEAQETEPEDSQEDTSANSEAYQKGVEAADKFGEWVDAAHQKITGEEDEANDAVDEAVDEINGFFATITKEG